MPAAALGEQQPGPEQNLVLRVHFPTDGDPYFRPQQMSVLNAYQYGTKHYATTAANSPSTCGPAGAPHNYVPQTVSRLG